MRHFLHRAPLLTAGAMPALALCVVMAAPPAGLVARPRRAQARTPGGTRVAGTAILLAAAAARADHNLRPTAPTYEQPGIVHRTLPAMSAGRPAKRCRNWARTRTTVWI